MTVSLSAKWITSPQNLFHSSEFGPLRDGQVWLDSVQIHPDLADSTGLRHRARSPSWLLCSWPSLTPSFFLRDVIFCKPSKLGFVHRWFRKKAVSQPLFSETLVLGSRSVLEEKNTGSYSLRSVAKVVSLNCKDLVCCTSVLKYVLLKSLLE